jgi:hypothetical protein
MNTDTGEVRPLSKDEILGYREVPIVVKKPNRYCTRCNNKRSVPIPGTRTARRKAIRMGLPVDAMYMPCPHCSRMEKSDES